MKSNCLWEAIKAKIRNPKFIIAVRTPHFYWEDGENCYDFYASEQNLPLWKTLWFEGYIRKFPLDWGEDAEEHF
jgi:hypothetical protein